jgi:hypothetical protein
MKKFIGVLVAIATTAGNAMAAFAPSVPEINPTAAIGALSLLGGSVLVVRARLKK